VLHFADRVIFDGAEHTIAALAGTSVRLVATSGQVCVVSLPHLLAAPDFDVVDGGRRRLMLRGLGLLDGLPGGRRRDGTRVGTPHRRGEHWPAADPISTRSFRLRGHGSSPLRPTSDAG
jgi:hypothetical protein